MSSSPSAKSRPHRDFNRALGGLLILASGAFATYLYAQTQPTAASAAAPSAATSWGTRAAPSTELDEEDDTESSFLVEAPEVVELGWGWSMSRAQPVPTVCVVFEPRVQLAQTSNISISEVRDSYALSKSMGVSASVSVNTMAYSGSGKAEFASSANVSSMAVNYLVNAEVLNSATYAGPVPDGRGVEGTAVRLTEAAAQMARRDMERFREVCGEGYVSGTITGARSYILSSVKTSSREDRQSMRAEVEGEGWGVKVKAAASASSSTATSNMTRDFVVYQQGGSAKTDPEQANLPEDIGEAIARIKRLADAASEAGKLMEVQVTPYQVLRNFPRGRDILPDEGEHDEITALMSAYTQLYADLTAALQEPEGFYVPIRACETAGTGDAATRACTVSFPLLSESPEGQLLIEEMQDAALAELHRMEAAAVTCVELADQCSFDVHSVRSPYHVRANLPLPVPLPEPGPEPDTTPSTQMEQSVPGEAAEAGTSPDPDDHRIIHLREQAASRCGFGAQTPGCISNAEVRAWAARTGLATAITPRPGALANTIARSCSGIERADILTGDPNAPLAGTLWFPPTAHVLPDGSVLCDL